MDDNTLWRVLEGFIGLFLALGAWIMKGMHADIREAQGDIATLQKDVSTNKATMDGAIGTIEDMREDIREVRSGINTLLQRVK